MTIIDAVRDQVWELCVQAREARWADRYEEAIALYSQAYDLGQDISSLYGRARAYLAANMPSEALTDFEEVIATTENRFWVASDFAYLGICHWYLAQPARAVSHWKAGLTAPYADAAGGVLLPVFLLYAGVRLADTQLETESHKLLKKEWQKHVRRLKRRKDPARLVPQNFATPELSSWPGAIVPYLLELGDTEWLLQQANNTSSETLAQRHLCQADFAIAVRALRTNDRRLFERRMQDCSENPKRYLEAESALARWEVLAGYPLVPFVASPG